MVTFTHSSLSSKDIRLRELAHESALDNTGQHFKMGCVIANGTKPICCGKNHFRTKVNSMRQMREPVCSCHAEIDAINRASSLTGRLKRMRSTLYIARVSSKGHNLCYAAPCSHCANVIAEYNIKYIVYSTGNEDEPWVKIKTRDYTTTFDSSGTRFIARLRDGIPET